MIVSPTADCIIVSLIVSYIDIIRATQSYNCEERATQSYNQYREFGTIQSYNYESKKTMARHGRWNK